MSRELEYRRREIRRIFATLDPSGRVLARHEYRLLRSYGLTRSCARGSFWRIATLLRGFPAEATT